MLNHSMGSIKKIIPFLLMMFSLDSLLKFTFGDSNLHVSIVLLTIIGLFAIILNPSFFAKWCKANPYLVAFFFYSLFSFPISINSLAYFKIISYQIVFVLICFSIFHYSRSIDYLKVFRCSIYFLFISGITQWFLYHVFNFQITLLDMQSEYYVSGGSIEQRLRGFFLEPNWFGIAILTTFIAYDINSKVDREWKVLAAITFLVVYLSDNRLILFLYSFYLALSVVSLYGINAAKISICLMLSVNLMLMWMLFNGEYFYDDRSISARSVTFDNVIFFIKDLPLINLFFGHGLSNWGSYSNEYGLSVLNFRGDQNVSSRDSSELSVILFEQGYAGVALLLMDLFLKIKQVFYVIDYSERFKYFFMLLLVPALALIYPIYTFMPYMIGYITVRVMLDEALRLRQDCRA